MTHRVARALRQVITIASVARLFIGTAGKAAVWRTLPLYLAVGIISVVLFGGNGMDAATLTREASAAPAFRAALLGSWVLAALPTARIWLGTPETFFVRALPVSRHVVLFVLGAGVVLLNAPWSVLWLRGAGLTAGLWAGLIAGALQCSVVAGVRSSVDGGVAALALALSILGPGHVSAVLAALILSRALALAWRRAAEMSSEGRGWVTSHGPLSAGITALGMAVWRGHPSVFSRAALLAVFAAWLVVLGIAHGAAEELGVTPLCLLFWAPASSLGAAALAGPLLRSERALEWTLRVAGAPPRVYAAPSLLLAANGVVWGGVFAAIVAAGSGLELGAGLRLGGSLATAGAATALLACFTARRTVLGDGRDAGRLTLASLGSISAWVVAIVTLGARALPLMALLSFGSLIWERGVTLRKVRRACSP